MKQESTTELRQALAQAHEQASKAEAKPGEAADQLRAVEAKIIEVTTKLRRAESELQHTIEQMANSTAKIQDLEQTWLDLGHQIQVLKRCLFGSRSEKISPSELESLTTEASQEATGEILKAKRPDQPPAEAEEEKPETSQSLPKSQREARPHGICSCATTKCGRRVYGLMGCLGSRWSFTSVPIVHNTGQPSF